MKILITSWRHNIIKENFLLRYSLWYTLREVERYFFSMLCLTISLFVRFLIRIRTGSFVRFHEIPLKIFSFPLNLMIMMRSKSIQISLGTIVFRCDGNSSQWLLRIRFFIVTRYWYIYIYIYIYIYQFIRRIVEISTRLDIICDILTTTKYLKISEKTNFDNDEDHSWKFIHDLWRFIIFVHFEWYPR